MEGPALPPAELKMRVILNNKDIAGEIKMQMMMKVKGGFLKAEC